MRRPSIVLFALFASMLVVSAAPASAADGDLVVGSEHTTGSDFTSGTLTNVSVSGSGESASVVLEPTVTTLLEDWDDGTLSDYSGDTGSASISTVSHDGPNSLRLESSYSNVYIYNTSSAVGPGDTFSTWVRPGSEGGRHGWVVFGDPTADGSSDSARDGYQAYIDADNEIRLQRVDNGSVTQLKSATPTINADNWYRLKVDWGADGTIVMSVYDDTGTLIDTISETDTTYQSSSFVGYGIYNGYANYDTLQISNEYTGGSYLSATHGVSDPPEGRVDLTLDNATADVTWQANTAGTWTNVSSATFSTGGTKTADLSSTSADQWRVHVGFETAGTDPSAQLGRDAVYFPVSTPDISAGSSAPSGGEVVHTSTPTLSVDVSDDDFGTTQGDELTVTWRVNGSVVDTTTRSSNGTASITAPPLPDGNHTWSVTVDDSYGETVSSAAFAFEIDHFKPAIDNSSLSPSDGTVLDTREPTISVDVSDGDFAYDGDQLTAEFFVNNESVGADTLNANGTASYDFSGAVGGENTVFVRVTDQFGQTVQSQTNTFSVPSNLTIYNESAPSQKLTNLSEPVTLRFYYDNGNQGQVIKRTTSNGTISLEGLPVDQSFVVVANAPGYLPRRIFVGSLLERQSIYLLNESAEHVDNLITLSDYSGQFDKSETVLIVQRSLNGSWETVQGDYFGATGEYSAQLAYNDRHRLVLRNTRTGQEKVVGSYTPLASGTKSIQVMQDGDVQLALDAPRIVVDPSVRSLSAVSNTQVIASVDNQSTELSSWSVEVVYHNATADERLFMTNSTSATGGTISPSLDLSGRAGGNVTVVVNWTTSSGESGSSTETFFVRESFTNEYGLLPVLGQVDSMIPDPNLSVFTTFVSVIVSVLVATGVARAFPASTEVVGVSAVGTLAFFSIIDWVGIPIVFVSGMSLIAFAALRRGL